MQYEFSVNILQCSYKSGQSPGSNSNGKEKESEDYLEKKKIDGDFTKIKSQLATEII